jgi:hypothetical protein
LVFNIEVPSRGKALSDFKNVSNEERDIKTKFP